MWTKQSERERRAAGRLVLAVVTSLLRFKQRVSFLILRYQIPPPPVCVLGVFLPGQDKGQVTINDEVKSTESTGWCCWRSKNANFDLRFTRHFPQRFLLPTPGQHGGQEHLNYCTLPLTPWLLSYALSSFVWLPGMFFPPAWLVVVVQLARGRLIC